MHYENVRYEFVIGSNEGFLQGQEVRSSGALTANGNFWEWVAIPDMNISKLTQRTVEQIITDFRLNASACADTSETTTTAQLPSKAVVKNRISMLIKALSILGVDASVPASDVLSTDTVEATIAKINQAQNLTQQRLSDLRSNIRWWSHRFTALEAVPEPEQDQQVISDKKQAKLGFILRTALRKKQLSQRKAAEALGMSLTTLEKWCNGAALPDFRSLEALRKIETFLDLAPLSLNDCLRKRVFDTGEKMTTRFGEQLKKLRKLRYRFRKDEITEVFRQDWLDFVAHQASLSPALKRSLASQWTYKPIPEGDDAPEWFESFRGQRCSSASVAWNSISGFLAFLTLSPEEGGLGVSRENAQTLAWLAVPHAIEGYLIWHRTRAGVGNNGLRNFSTYASALCRRETGYLRQQPALAQKLPVGTVADWDEACERVLTMSQKTGLTARSHSRDPFEGLEYYFSFADPAEPVLNSIRHLTSAAAVVRRGSVEYAITLRDAALLAFVLLAPLRLETLRQLRIGNDRQVVFTDDSLALRIPELMIKNGSARGALKMEFQSELLACISSYLDEARPILAAATETDLLFFSSARPTKPWGGLSIRITDLTRRYCQGNAIPLHSIRHLVATRHLRENPGDIVGAAYLLHDSTAMVMNTYIKRNDGTLEKHGKSFKL